MRFVIGYLVTAIFTMSAGNEAAQSADFEKKVAPFFKQHCVRCHGSEKPKGDLRLTMLKGAILPSGGETGVWKAILQRLQSRDMPPKKEPQPDAKKLEVITDWIRTELRKVGQDDSAELAYPNKGNYLDHKRLFDSPPGAVAATPARIWRINLYQYWAKMERLKPHAPAWKPKIPNPFGLTTDLGFRDYAFRYTVGAPEVQQMMLNARLVAAYLTGYDQLLRTITRQKERATDKQTQAAVDWMFDQLLLRKPTIDEQKRYAETLAKSIKRFGNQQGLVEGLAPIFLHPEVYYRMELGEGPSDKHGRVMLGPRELAFAIAYALTDEVPDEHLRKAAREGQLSSRKDVRVQVVRILNDPKIEKPRILRFFREYFGYHRSTDVFKDKAITNLNRLSPIHLVEDTDHLILYILRNDKDVLRELLTTNKSFVQYRWIKVAKELAAKGKDARKERNHRGYLGRYYNLEPDQWQMEQPMTLPAEQRAGILTQPSWLYAFSNNIESLPIQRGKWIYERLLGGTVPETPITVDAQLPDEPYHTLRKRMRFTREQYCWTCHQRMNPFGLAFEMFDGYGQYRTEELVVTGKNRRGEPIHNGVPVNSAAKVIDGAVTTLGGNVTGAVELMHRLAESERVHQVFVRHAFRYWMGRNETLDDAATLQAAYRAYKDNGGSMKALIVSLLTSDSFLYRWPEIKR